MNEVLANLYKQGIESLPLHQFLGLKILKVGEFSATVRVNVDSHTLNPGDAFHGGVIYLVADVTAFAAVGPSLGENDFAVSIDT